MIELACIEPKIAQPNQKSKERDCTVMAITRIPPMRSAIPTGKQQQKNTTFVSDAMPCGKEQHAHFMWQRAARAFQHPSDSRDAQ